MIVEAERREQTFLLKDGVQVTNARFVVPDHTYAISGVTSVRLAKEKPDTLAGIVGLVIGAWLVTGTIVTRVNGEGGVPMVLGIIGILLVGLGIYVLKYKKRRHTIILKTAAGEERALTSTDESFIREVAEALSSAIIYRG